MLKQIKPERWEKLHSLDKLKSRKFEDKRKIIEEKKYEEERIKCTFSPKLNHLKSTSLLLEMEMSQRLIHYKKKRELSINKNSFRSKVSSTERNEKTDRRINFLP